MEEGQILGRRIAAAVIDAFIVLVLLVVAAKTLGKGDESRSILAESKGGGARPVWILLTFLYFFATELAWGQTIGKRVMKLRVVNLDGSRLGAGPALIRNLVRFVDAIGLYLVGAIAFFTVGNKKARLGDLAAKTKVVADDTPPPPPPEQRARPDDDDVIAQVLGR